ncbi:MAG TPA: methyl-accepting chemotaxis protein, partial [Pseudomonas sp.]|nr:methyl-accepting chemotaxis protein [Pseudomonas sp.]
QGRRLVEHRLGQISQAMQSQLDQVRAVNEQAQAITGAAERSNLSAGETLQAAQALAQLVLDLHKTASRLSRQDSGSPSPSIPAPPPQLALQAIAH